jgi:hypothetical protein
MIELGYSGFSISSKGGIMQAAIFPSIAEQIENLARELSVESGLLANAMLEFFLEDLQNHPQSADLKKHLQSRALNLEKTP